MQVFVFLVMHKVDLTVIKKSDFFFFEKDYKATCELEYFAFVYIMSSLPEMQSVVFCFLNFWLCFLSLHLSVNLIELVVICSQTRLHLLTNLPFTYGHFNKLHKSLCHDLVIRLLKCCLN